jgi:4-amino-4-deoxy-L-arabinose transferase-like glycosyltransferase
MEGPPANPTLQKEQRRPASKVWPAIQPGAHSPLKQDEPARPLSRELTLLALLLLVAAGIRAWLIGHTEVAARDSVGFIRYALELERYPWKEVLQRNLQHPGYPVMLLAVSFPVRHLLGGTNSISLQLSAQLTSALAGVLLVVPMFYLGRDLLGRRAGFWGTALFQCLPVSARVMSDGLSEATFLLFAATALLFAVRGLSRLSAARFAACGFFSGLAYLTRPEGALIVAATGLVLVATQFTSTWRRSWLRTFSCAAALLLAATAVGSPYVLVNGRLTNKPTPRSLWETPGLEEAPDQSRAREQDLQTTLKRSPIAPRPWHSSSSKGSHGPLTASVLAMYAPENLRDRRLWGLYAVVTEATKDFQYLAALSVLLGMWHLRSVLKTVRGSWVLLILAFLHSLVLWRVAVVVGYVSDRHVLVLLLCGAFTAAGGVFAFGDSLAWFAHRLWAGRTADSVPAAESGKLAVILLLALIGFGLQEALKPLHANRAGHRQAGLWLAEHTSPADPVADPFCWAHYYAGRLFWEGLTPPVVPDYIPTQYVVMEKSSTSEHSRLPTIHQAKALAARGQVVYHWPVEKPETEAKILVYAVRP